jgi:hypothetical protein
MPEGRQMSTMTNHQQKQFFARTNAYGSDTSAGFDNTFSAVVFESRAARDAYIAENSATNLAVKPLTKAQALKLAVTIGDASYLPTVDGRYAAVK